MLEVPNHWTTPRHKAAFVRKKLSSPVAIAIDKGIITHDDTILDYGTGKGQVVELLQQQGYNAVGYDPYYFPNTPLESADVVMLCYVAGVIENSLERSQTIEKAWHLTNKTLLIAAQVQHSRGKIQHGDGWLTKWSTFAKYWTEPEWRKYVEGITGIRAKRIGKGILVLSKQGGGVLETSRANTPPEVSLKVIAA